MTRSLKVGKPHQESGSNEEAGVDFRVFLWAVA